VRFAVKAEESAKWAHVTDRKSRRVCPTTTLIVPGYSPLELELRCAVACVPICTLTASCHREHRRSHLDHFAASARGSFFLLMRPQERTAHLLTENSAS
jgi:hypothetical protein